MNVGFNPQVSFKSDTNLIAAKVNNATKPQTVKLPDSITKSQEVRFPDSWETEEQHQKKNEEAAKTLEKITAALEEGRSLDGIIKGTHWTKEYNSKSKSVLLSIPNTYDGTTYSIKEDGTVIRDSGWSNPEEVMKANDKMAKYVKAVKEGKVEEYLNDLALKEAQSNGNYATSNESKAELFRETLHSRKWEKEYLPESDIIVFRHKKIKDGTDYMMEKDGTVKEFGLRIKPTVIIEPSIEGAKEFGKLKAKLSGEKDKTQTSLWYKMKSAVANIWKFFQVTSTMTVATTKGLAEGIAVGTGVLASAWILRGGYNKIVKNIPIKEIAQTPLKTAGKAGILLSAAAGVIVMAGEIIAGRMKANQQSAVIEHKLDVAHDLT